jgi:hypothetical protein
LIVTIRTTLLAVTVAALPVAIPGVTLAQSPMPSGAPASPVASPVIDPADFTATVDNPWFPLVPGTTLIYHGRKDGKASVDTFAITSDVATIDGVPCVVIHDVLTQGGTVFEDTTDWYSQDSQGNVWYFGEDTRTLNAKGKVVSTEGTWQAGVDGAQPGIFMPADPQIGQSFPQESFPGQAEDWFVVTQMGVPTKVPYGSFDGAMLTVEWTPLEPTVLSEKVYVQGTGEVREFDVTGSNEHFALVSVTKP